DLEKLAELAALNPVKAGLPAQAGQREALANSAFHGVARVAHDGQKRVREPFQVGPVDALGSLEPWWRQTPPCWGRPPITQAFALDQFADVVFQFGHVNVGAPAAIGGHRWAGESDPHAPAIPRGNQHEWEQSARQGLGLRAKPFVDPAPTVFGKENARAV